MKPKGLFDGVPEPADDRFDGEQTHFASFRRRCEPIQKWLESHFGKVAHAGTWRYLECRIYGVHIRVTLEETEVEWCVGFADKGTKRVGWTSYGDGWEKRIPPAVWLAAEYVKKCGGSGL